MNNHHQPKDKLTWQDVLLMFMLKAPDQKKAIAAMEVLYGRDTVKDLIAYKHTYPTLQDWHAHLIAALDNAQAQVDATKTKP